MVHRNNNLPGKNIIVGAHPHSGWSITGVNRPTRKFQAGVCVKRASLKEHCVRNPLPTQAPAQTRRLLDLRVSQRRLMVVDLYSAIGRVGGRGSGGAGENVNCGEG